MSGDKRDGNFSAGKQHGEIFHAAAVGKKFRLSGKLETDLVHARFMDRSGHDGVDCSALRQRDGLFQRRGRGRAVSRVGLPNDQSGILADNNVIRRISGSCPEVSAARTISGPMPAGSPRVMPMRCQNGAIIDDYAPNIRSAAQADALT